MVLVELRMVYAAGGSHDKPAQSPARPCFKLLFRGIVTAGLVRLWISRYVDDLAACTGQELEFGGLTRLFQFESGPNHGFKGAISEAREHVVVDPCEHA